MRSDQLRFSTRTRNTALRALSCVCALALAGCGDGGVGVGGERIDNDAMPLTCSVRFHMQSSGLIETLQFAVDYSQSSGRLLWRDDVTARCRALIGQPAALHTSPRRDAEPTGAMQIILSRGPSGPGPVGFPAGDIVTCDFEASEPPRSSDFAIAVGEASSGDYASGVVASVGVGSIDCDGEPQPSTTTTTLADMCAGLPCAEPRKCFEGVCVAPALYEIDIELSDAVVVGSLQVGIEDIGCDDGSFIMLSEAHNAWCDFEPGLNSLVASSAHGCKLTVGLVAPVGLQGPTPIATCRFEGAHRGLVPADFSVTIEDAATVDIEPITPTVTVTDVRWVFP